jgi:hypothetical protein
MNDSYDRCFHPFYGFGVFLVLSKMDTAHDYCKLATRDDSITSDTHAQGVSGL